MAGKIIAEASANRGISPFWSQGIHLRACGVADVFPEEPRALAALAAAMGLPATPSGEELYRLAGAYRPYRIWVAVLLRMAAGRGLGAG